MIFSNNKQSDARGDSTENWFTAMKQVLRKHLIKLMKMWNMKGVDKEIFVLHCKQLAFALQD